MKRMASLVPLVLFILTGCATAPVSNEAAWTKEGASTVDIRRDLAACRLEGERFRNHQAYGLIPAAMESGRQNRMVSDCMISKGYTPVEQSKKKNQFGSK